jgi:hypothetical protein
LAGTGFHVGVERWQRADNPHLELTVRKDSPLKLAPIVAAAFAFGLLTACDDKPECTKEVIETKSAEMMKKLEEVVTKDPAKLASIGPKIQEIATKAAAAGEADLQASCDAIDGIMAELNK